MIGPVRFNGGTTCLAMEGGSTGEAFCEYVHRLLVPTLSLGDIVIADNLSAHENRDAQELMEAAGAKIVFLPPYLITKSSNRTPWAHHI
jgi:transposase